MSEDVESLKRQLDELKAENQKLKQERLGKAVVKPPAPKAGDAKVDEQEFNASEQLKRKALTVVVFGASGHLAHTKTYPALFALFNRSLLPDHVSIVGFARSKTADEDFRKSLQGKLKGADDVKAKFLQRCTYFAGDYDNEAAYRDLDARLKEVEAANGGPDANRVFYFAIPPQIFPIAAKHIKSSTLTSTGWNRVVIEKPFGKDSDTSRTLSQSILACFNEDQIYRIDHYLGKEMVQNLMVLRFANVVFEPVWNHHYINSVLITFKEPQGIEGRGQYFDEYGIIRDVMQNHLMQMLSLVAMEPPVTLSAEDTRNEKVKVLRAIEPIQPSDIVIGQYVGDAEKNIPGYQDDPSVPKGSLAPTFAAAVLRIRNPRWEGVPFILKCGKAIDSKKAEVRVQFKQFPGQFFGGELPVNELVLRVQPDEAIYLKMNAKSPGLTEAVEQTELNLSYHSRFKVKDLPDAYERLILDVLRGDHRLFVRDDELQFAWDIFTPVLHHLENNKVKPLPYKIGSRGPAEADELIAQAGFKRYEGYEWIAVDK